MQKLLGQPVVWFRLFTPACSRLMCKMCNLAIASIGGMACVCSRAAETFLLSDGGASWMQEGRFGMFALDRKHGF